MTMTMQEREEHSPTTTEIVQAYDVYDGQLRLERCTDRQLMSGTISEHSSETMTVSAAAPFLLDEKASIGMKLYHKFEGVDL